MTVKGRIFVIRILVGGTLLGAHHIAAYAEAPQTARCVQRLCEGASAGAESLGSFLARENTDHPQLETVMQSYQARIDEVRLARQQRMTQALGRLQDPAWLDGRLAATDDATLLNLFLELHPWNVGSDLRNGKMVVVPEPLVSSIAGDRMELIRSLFNRFMTTSPLYKLQVESDKLQVDARQFLQVGTEVEVKKLIIGMIDSHLSELPPLLNAKFKDQFKLQRQRLEAMAGIYGARAYTNFGELDLSMALAQGKIPLTREERQILVEVLRERVNGHLDNKLDISLERIYQKTTWDRVCRKAINRSLHYGLTDSDAERITALKKDALARAISTSREIFGSDLTEALKKFFVTVDIAGPFSLANYFKLMDVMLEVGAHQSFDADNILDVYNMIYDLRKEGDSSVESICNTFIYQPLRDQESGTRVILSSYSLRNYKMGLAIATHEMGHAASQGMIMLAKAGLDTTRFMDMRRCLNHNYEKIPRLGTHFTGDRLWTEEDWADAFSGRSTRDLKTLNSCTFLGAFPERDFVSTAKRGEDEHSPTFYRVLNIQMHAEGRISCEPEVRAEFPGTEFADCLTPK